MPLLGSDTQQMSPTVRRLLVGPARSTSNDHESDCTWTLTRQTRPVASFSFYHGSARKVTVNGTLEHGPKFWDFERVYDDQHGHKSCNVVIKSVGLGAEGTWRCFLNFYNGQSSWKSLEDIAENASVSIVVAVPPKSVSINISQPHGYLDGGVMEVLPVPAESNGINWTVITANELSEANVTLTCFVRGTKPAPQVRWFKKSALLAGADFFILFIV
jgi:hypothetical protein